MNEAEYKELTIGEINSELFQDFNRYQEVKKCWRKEEGQWILKDIAFTEQWSLEDYDYLIHCLLKTINTGGAVFGAFLNQKMVGFASVEGEFFGSGKEYLQLSNIHISYDKRGMGIGKNLFSMICSKGRVMGARKLYISAHSSEESQAFYQVAGCVEAAEYNEKLVQAEPCDCQLEFTL